MTVEERLEDLERKIHSFATEHAEFRSVHVSRRGPEGGRGERGEIGHVGATGPAGKDGKDADITQVVEAALKRVREEFDAEYKLLSEVVRHELKKSGVIDEDNKAILIPGPIGPASEIRGPKGDSIIGPAGRDGVDGADAKIVIGSVAVGPEAFVTVHEENGVHVLDFVLPKAERGEQGSAGRDGADSVVPGPAGPEGREGIKGLPGEGLSRQDLIELILDMKKRGTLK